MVVVAPVGGRGRFDNRMEVLRTQVGGGKLTARLVVDQVYAAFQHEHLGLRHPEGGEAKYLTKTLMNVKDAAYGHLAHGVLRGSVRESMVDVAEWLSNGVYKRAPMEFGDLRASGHPSVKDGGRIFYDRAPNVPRLNKAALRAKARVRGLGLGN